MEGHPLFPTILILAEAVHRCDEALAGPGQDYAYVD
jgi:hypothetical protein